MKNRPTSVSIIGWIFLAAGLYSSVATPFAASMEYAQQVMATELISPDWQISLGILGGVLTAYCGFSFLKGRDHGRKLYIGWALGSTIINGFAMNSWVIAVPGLLMSGVAVAFLYLPNANRFFRGEDLLSTPLPPGKRRFFSILSYIWAGFYLHSILSLGVLGLLKASSVLALVTMVFGGLFVVSLGLGLLTDRAGSRLLSVGHTMLWPAIMAAFTSIMMYAMIVSGELKAAIEASGEGTAALDMLNIDVQSGLSFTIPLIGLGGGLVALAYRRRSEAAK